MNEAIKRQWVIDAERDMAGYTDEEHIGLALLAGVTVKFTGGEATYDWLARPPGGVGENPVGYYGTTPAMAMFRTLQEMKRRQRIRDRAVK